MSKLSKLDYISAGTINNNPAEILNSVKLQSLLTKLNELYDIVILDTPPVLAVADTEVLSNFVQGNLLIASANNTEMDWLVQAASLLKKDENSFLGVVLNNYDFKFGYPSSYKYHGYYYSHDEKKKSRRK
jgi:Mrp family chromosome partitioning ATPase